MASAVLAGANPVQGLYAIMIGTPLGAIFGSSAFMNVSATSALAITAGSALADAGFTGDAHASAISTLAVLTGVVMVLAGLLKMGRLLRFVANSVVIGFLTGVSINVILSQLSDFTGYSSEYSNKVVKAIDTLLHLNQIDLPTTAIGLLTVAVILLVDRTRLRNFSMLIGMVIASAGGDSPGPDHGAAGGRHRDDPDLAAHADAARLLADACPVAGRHRPGHHRAGAGRRREQGLSQPGRQLSRTRSRDFIGQGAANIGAGLLQGMPIGGSVSSTALNVSSGAQSRWANIFSGLLVVLAVLLFSQAVSMVAMPAMAGLLIVAGFQSIKIANASRISGSPAGRRASSWPSRSC